MPRPLIIFDYDGVLVDTLEYFEREFRTELAAIGKDFLKTRKDLLDLFNDSLAVSLIERGLTPDEMCALWEHIMQRAAEAEAKWFRGIPEMLSALRPLCEMAIVSANASPTVRSQLERLGGLDAFRSISGGEEDVRKAGRIAACMQQLGGDPARTFYVCDTAGDVREAREAGVKALVVTWGWHPPKRLETARPDGILKSPDDLVDLVRTLAPAV